MKVNLERIRRASDKALTEIREYRGRELAKLDQEKDEYLANALWLGRFFYSDRENDYKKMGIALYAWEDEQIAERLRLACKTQSEGAVDITTEEAAFVARYDR